MAADLVARGCQLSIPFGEDCSYDLIADFEGRLHRVQVKFTKSDGRVIVVLCRSHSLTKGKSPAHQDLHRGDGRLDRRLRRDDATAATTSRRGCSVSTGRSDLLSAIDPRRSMGNRSHPSGRGLPRSRLQSRSVSGASRIRTGGLLRCKGGALPTELWPLSPDCKGRPPVRRLGFRPCHSRAHICGGCGRRSAMTSSSRREPRWRRSGRTGRCCSRGAATTAPGACPVAPPRRAGASPAPRSLSCARRPACGSSPPT